MFSCETRDYFVSGIPIGCLLIDRIHDSNPIVTSPLRVTIDDRRKWW